MRLAIERTIREHGQHLWAVGGSGHHPFVYTIGNHEKGLPELIVIGLPFGLAAMILNYIGTMQRLNGKAFEEGLIDIELNHPVKLRKCGPRVKEHYTFQATFYYDTTDYDVYQVIMYDEAGRFPGDDGFDTTYNVDQP